MTDVFIPKAREVHGDKYKYDRVGEQHYKDRKGWGMGLEVQQARDTLKEELANSNGFKVFRVKQVDIKDDLINWRKQIYNIMS